MTQFVFLLFENGRVPVDSEDRYKIEIHFSPGAKEREEIIASGESVFRRDFKKNNIRLKRMLPALHDDIMTENLSLSNMPSVKVQKRTSKSLPTLVSKEELKMVRTKATQISIFEEEEESQNVDKPTSLPILQHDTESQTINDNINTVEEFCKLLFLLFQACSCYFVNLAGIDLASSVKPLQRLCTISLTEIQHFLSHKKCDQQGHRTSTDSIFANLASS